MCDNSERKTVLCCLFGGRSTEYEVSLMSVCGVLENVDRSHYDVITIGITREGTWYYYDGEMENIRNNTWWQDTPHLQKAMPDPSYGKKQFLVAPLDSNVYHAIDVDVIFPVMHGANAEDGNLQGLLTMCGIPYVGPHHCASAIGMDKAYTKLVINNFAIPQARHCVILRSDFQNNAESALYAAETVSTYPLFVKPANAGSSVGCSKAHNRTQLHTALENALRFDCKAIVEEYICGREVECAVLGNEKPIASTPGEINPGSDFYDYDTKYITDTSRDFIPARISAQTKEKIREYAIRIFSVLGCRGLSRVDFFVVGEGESEKIIFNEINTLPGFTKISMYPKLFVHDGISYSSLIDRLIALAMEENA